MKIWGSRRRVGPMLVVVPFVKLVEGQPWLGLHGDVQHPRARPHGFNFRFSDLFQARAGSVLNRRGV